MSDLLSLRGARSQLGMAACCCAVLSISCSEGPVEPPASASDLAQSAAPKGPNGDDDALSIEAMLADGFFQDVVLEITEPEVSEPLGTAIEALAKGQLNRATNLIKRAADAADQLEDGGGDTPINWSVLERFFEEAELI